MLARGYTFKSPHLMGSPKKNSREGAPFVERIIYSNLFFSRSLIVDVMPQFALPHVQLTNALVQVKDNGSMFRHILQQTLILDSQFLETPHHILEVLTRGS